MRNRIRFARGNEAQRKASTVTPEEGQPVFETDTRKLFIGDGSTQLKNLNPVAAGEAEKLVDPTTRQGLSVGSPKELVYFNDGVPKVGQIASKTCDNLNKVCQMLDTVPLDKIISLEFTVPAPSIHYYTHSLVRHATTEVIEPIDSSTNLGTSTYKINFVSGVPYDSTDPDKHRYYTFKSEGSSGNFSTSSDRFYTFGYNLSVYNGYDFDRTGLYLRIHGSSWSLGVSRNNSQYRADGEITFTQYDSYYCAENISSVNRYGDMNLSGTYTVNYYI